MFNLEFYENSRGESKIVDWLDELGQKAKTDKTARITWRKILAYFAALQEKGVLLGKPYVKHIEEDIWELRPLQNRVFFFLWKDATYVLLHYYVKKTKKMPKHEFEKAKANRDEWLERHRNEKS